jgi:nitroreductase
MNYFAPFPEREGSASSVTEAIEGRFSARAFQSRMPSREILREILRLASRAPSGTNTQPWKVYVVQGKVRDELVQKVCAVHNQSRENPAILESYKEAYDYYPREWISPYIDRRRENGWSLYGLLDIAKGEREKMHQQQPRNYGFFDAPVGIFVTIDKIMGQGSLLDTGMFLQNLMLAAREKGLHTCAQAAWNPFASIVLPILKAGDNETLVCGVSIGYADSTNKVNSFHTPREEVESFTIWVD